MGHPRSNTGGSLAAVWRPAWHEQHVFRGNRRERSWGLAFVLAITLFIAAALSLNANPSLADQTDAEAPATQPATAAAATDAATTTDAPAASAATETRENNVAALTAGLNNGIATQAVNGDAGPLEVFFLVLIDRDWVYVDANGNIYDSPNDEGYVKSYTTHQDTNWGGKGAGRWFVTGDQLEQIYGPKFGFKVTDLIYSKRSGEGQAMFPHVEEGGAGASKPRGTIWADTRPWYSGSLGATSELDEAAKWRIPGVTITNQSKGKRIYYYYLPNNTEDSTRNPQKYPDYFTSSASPNDSARVNGSSFFSVGMDDREGLVYTDGEQVPSVAYALARRSFSYTVKAAGADVTWNVYMDGVLLDPSSGRFSANYNSDGTVTYTFPYDYASEQGNGTNLGVTGRVVFAPTKSQAGIHSIAYIAAMSDDQKQDVGDYTSSLQRLNESTNATVGGKSQTIETFDEAEGDVYTVLAPDTDQVTTTDEYAWNSNGRKFLYEFKGWKVSGTNTILQAGQQLTADDLKLLAPSGLLSLKAQWSILLDNGYSTTCNFFVNTSCEVKDNLQNGYTSHTGSDYTTSVYATSVYGAEGIAKQVEDGKVKTKTIQVTETDTQMNCYELDQMLRNSATTPVPVEYDYSGVDSAHPDKRPTRVDYSGPGISLKQMPSDEQALAGVRAWVNADSSHKVTIDGESIAASDITSANFTVRWYVLKNEKSDGWHVDGILVAKKAQMVVAKTFEGDSEAIDKLTGYGASTFDASNSDDFYVQVSHTETVNGASQDVTDYQLLTVPDSEVKRTGTSDRRYGYSSYDASTNTYYWEVNTRQGREYSVSEMNSVYTGSDPTVSWNNSRWVNVRNSGSSDTNGWVEYDRNNSVDVRLRAASLPADLPLSSRQTVSFRNMYVHSGTLVVRKADYTTGDPMAGVKFQIMSAVNSEFESLSLYRKTGTHEYTTDTAAAADPAYEKVDDAKAETDENGTFYLALGVRTSETTKTGTYRLVEDYDTAPGYTGARSITVAVTDDKGIDGNIVVDGDDSGITWAHKGMSDFTLEVVNRSQELTTLAAKKRWETTSSDGEEGDDTEKPVKVQLWRRYGPEGSQRVEEVPDGTFTQNGVEVPRLVDENDKPASNTVELSAANNWCFRWGALPLFIDNCEVTYFLRETWIGDTSYDAGADADSGYAAYKVTYDEARFTNTASPRPGGDAVSHGERPVEPLAREPASGQLRRTRRGAL